MNEDLILSAKQKDLGGFSVARALPQVQCRHLGPFVFLDHMGPMNVDDRHKLDVRPHPHIGLATVTYLFSGKGFHRDSLGSQQLISPGDINWMTAGNGIVHSERTPKEELTAAGSQIHGVQIWVALPIEQEDCEPSFIHWPKSHLPTIELSPALKIKILLGKFKNQTSPAVVLSPTLFLDLHPQADGSETLNFTEKEVGIFVVAGEMKINGQITRTNDLYVSANPQLVKIEFNKNSRAVVVGGESHPEPRHMWWNFVSSDKEKIRKAAAKWTAQQMGRVPGETEFIPLPEIPLP